MRVPIQQPRNLNHSQGYFLLELVIAAGILVVGLLGVGSMHIAALKLGDSAIKRGEAAVRIQEMSSRMRANRVAISNGTYNLPTKTPVSNGHSQTDIQAWFDSIALSHGTQALAKIDCSSLLSLCTLEIQWDDALPQGQVLSPAPATPLAYSYQTQVVF